MGRVTRWLLAGGCACALAACSSSVVRTPAPERPVPVPKPRVSIPKHGQAVVVQRGDTLFSIATRNGITVPDLAAWNRLPAPYTIYPGQRLRLYPGGASVPQRASGRAAGDTPARRAPAATPAAPAAPPSSGFAWQWPAQGELVGRFVPGEPTRQGIDIAGSAGSPVRAAADGTVVYSGAGLVGYGELVIINHGEQWLSAYGHNRKRLVKEGQRVRAGEQVAEMGRSGAPRDMLHFEVRYLGKPVDPLRYLPPR